MEVEDEEEETSEDCGTAVRDTRMAVRLMGTLDYQHHMRCLMRRFIMERWPQNVQKHKSLAVFTEKCVPESQVREEKDYSEIKALIDRSINTLFSYGQRSDGEPKSCALSPLHELSMGKVQEMSDLGIVKQTPFLICNLNKQALKRILFCLTGRQLTSNHRYIAEREVKAEFVKLNLPSSEEGLPDSLLKVARILRSLSSYRHNLGSNNPHLQFFSKMWSSPLAAAHEAFAHLGSLPTHVVVEVRKMLKMEDNSGPFGHKTHTEAVGVVTRDVKQLLNSLEEGDPLPACVEGALHVVSLAVKLLFCDDGGLARLLKPLSPEQLSLEKEFKAAYIRLETMDAVDLSKICDVLGKMPRRKKHQYVNELQRMMIGSMHCIYACHDIPEDVATAISMINGGSLSATKEATKMEGSDRIQESAPILSLHKKGTRGKRSRAELEAVLDLSAQFRRVLWECIEALNGHAFVEPSKFGDAEPSIVDQANIEVDLSPSSFNFDVDSANAEKNQSPKIKISVDDEPEESRRRGTLQQDLKCFELDVEAFADEAAAVVYVLIGCLLKEFSVQQSVLLGTTAVEYLQTGLDKLQESRVLRSNLPSSFESLDGKTFMLDMVKKLKVIPPQR